MSLQQKQMLRDFFNVLADENRLTLIGLLNEKAYPVVELVTTMQLPEPAIAAHLAQLRDMGLVNLRSVRNQRCYTLNSDNLNRWKAMVMDLENINKEPDRTQPDKSWINDLPLDDYDKKVIKDYTEGRYLKFIPAQEKKVLSVLRWIIMDFEPDLRYTEHEVNTIITQYHEDYARLRREMIDADMLRRESNGATYWLTPQSQI